MNNEFSLVYTITELAQILKISKSSAYKLARRKDFPKIYVGKKILIPSEELNDWILNTCNECVRCI